MQDHAKHVISIVFHFGIQGFCDRSGDLYERTET